MARSQYIYIVTVAGGGWVDIVAAFTVKHELVTWLRNNPAPDHRVTRVNDGLYGERLITEMNVGDLLA
ncbi:hypothetical protein [Nocardia asiatica]